MTESSHDDAQRLTVLFCPLDWGLGHASRDIPLMRSLIKQGYKVVLASSTPLKALLEQSIPELIFEKFEGPLITYSKNRFLILKLLTKLPEWLLWFKREKNIISRLVDKHKPYCIISDNRYGARHPKVKSIIITHQLSPKLPSTFKWAESLVNKIVVRLVCKFDECWIPDFPQGQSLAGDLVHKYLLPKNARLIGPISRFMDETPDLCMAESYRQMALLSGPEPQKSMLKKMISRKFGETSEKSLIVSGNPESNLNEGVNPFPNITTLPHLDQGRLRTLILETPMLICRSGYSTIMDLYFLNKSAVIIPTPGQTEQEYLAQYHSNKHLALSQHDFSKLSMSELSSALDAFRHQKNTIHQKHETFSPLLHIKNWL
jgi:UDP:flavonoid glycosyltransferase YjiC (YdhE family)